MIFLKNILNHLCGLVLVLDYKPKKLPANRDQEVIISNKLETLRLKISNWQTAIDKDPITFDGIDTDHSVLKRDIHSLYQEALYAQVTDKLSYDIIGLVALIDRVKRAANRYLRNEERIASTRLISNIVASDIKESLSEPGSVPCDCYATLANEYKLKESRTTLYLGFILMEQSMNTQI